MESVPFLLVTANVGSVFEDPCRLLKSWINEFLSVIVLKKPSFIALHLQEVGGKTYEKSLEYVQEFIKQLCESDELRDYNRIRIYLDEDFNSPEHFTALGNLYFAQKSVMELNIWNFLTRQWESVDGKNIHTGNIESVATKEKAKFPQNFFPECKWSRKGFLRTRWCINGTIIDMVNIHLFHDASNLAALEEYPSVYCKSRRRALIHTLERFYRDKLNGSAPYFIFGDFNFRCDTGGVVNRLTEHLTMHRQQSKNDHNKIQYRDSDGTNILTVGKKEFTHNAHQTTFKENWLQEFDRELDPLKDVLLEYPITFPPSYPYEEDPQLPYNYMATRCPAWCDRILMSPTARQLIENQDQFDYSIIGNSVCMGDHKPIYLELRMKSNQGTIQCCCSMHDKENSSMNRNVQNINVVKINSQTSCPPPPPTQSSHLYHSYNNKINPPAIVSAAANNNVVDVVNDNNPAGIDVCLYCSQMFMKLLEKQKLLLKNNNHENHSTTKSERTIDRTTSTRFNLSDRDDNNINDDESSSLNNYRDVINDKLTIINQNNFVRINVTDTENNLNVCMCAFYNENNSENNLDAMINKNSDSVVVVDKNCRVDGTICPQCRNIIKQQTILPRRTLISKRSMLANDIIVNRIDSHYLNTYPSYDPYTPDSDSIESHSPFQEVFEYDLSSKYLNELDGGVSPGQLKSKLEMLQKSSESSHEFDSEIQNLDDDNELFIGKKDIENERNIDDNVDDDDDGNHLDRSCLNPEIKNQNQSKRTLNEPLEFIEKLERIKTSIDEDIDGDEIIDASQRVTTRYVELAQADPSDVFYSNSVIFRETTI